MARIWTEYLAAPAVASPVHNGPFRLLDWAAHNEVSNSPEVRRVSRLGPAVSLMPGTSPTGPRVFFAVILLFQAALGLYFLQFHTYNLNPDAISYLSIAQKYRAGNFSDAINGYWGPLFSWLLAPFVSSSQSPVLASKVLALAASGALIAGARALSYRFAMTELVRGALLMALAPVGVYMALCDRTPDLLVATTLLFYLSLILDDQYRRTSRGWGCGVLGGLSFFAKSFSFPFFLVHFVAFTGLHYCRGETGQERRRVMRNCLSGLVVFTLISGVWVAVLSMKYGGLTIATAAQFNIELSGSGYPHNSMLLPPPNPSAVSYWEDPHLVLRNHATGNATDGSANPLRKSNHRRTRASSILRNLRVSGDAFQSFSMFSIAVLIGAAWLARPWAPASTSRDRAQDVLLTLAIYCGAYALVVIEPRYLWVGWPLVMIVGFHLASGLTTFRRVRAVQASGAVLILAFAVSCWVEPWAFLQGEKAPAGRSPEQVRQMLEQLGVRGRIASDTQWGRTLALAFHNRWQYYGITGHGRDGRDVLRELAEHDIDYYLVWNPGFDVGGDWKEVPNGPIRRLRIYAPEQRQ